MPTLKILPIGDSITLGDEGNATSFRSYRGALLAKLQAAGYSVDFVGRVQSTPATGGTDPDCEAYGGAYISDAGVGAMNANNNLQDRIASMKSEIGAVDIIQLMVGWNDTYNQPTNAGTRYATLISTVQSGVWASAKLVLFTLHPERSKTPAQTGSDNPAWEAINGAVRAAVAASPTTRFLVDLAGLSGSGDATSFVEGMLYDALNAPDFTTTKGGNALGMPKGGHLVTSFKSMQDYNANWSTARGRRAGPNGNLEDGWSDPNVAGHPRFINSVAAVVPWLWTFAAPGHASQNTVLEARNMFAGARRKSNGQWGFFFSGARPGAEGLGDAAVYDRDMPGFTSGVRDGLTSMYRVDGNTNIEVWPHDTTPSRGIESFLGGRNRSLMVDAEVFIMGVQVRLARLDPNGVDDIGLSRIGCAVGCDFSTVDGAYGLARYDYYGWPLQRMDGGHDRYKIIRSTNWVWVTSITIGRNSASWLGPNATEHFEDPGLQPPLADWTVATPYNDMPTYSVTVASIRSNPPPLPPYYTASSSASAGGWVPGDYFDSIHMSQAGAEKTAQAVYDALVASGALGGSSGGDPVTVSLLPGVPSVGAWFARNVTEATTPDTATWGSIQVAQDTAPLWGIQGLPVAVQGVAYTATMSASASPAPTFSIVSGAPAWMSVSGATLVGTPPAGPVPPIRNVTLRATNSAGSADITLQLTEVATATITTTTLPSAEQNVAYLQQLAAAGAAPFTWSLSSGTLPAGLTLSPAGIISGTPTALGSSTFTVRADGAGGQSATRSLTIVVGATGNAPDITSVTLSDATVGTAYSVTVGATGATPRTWSIIAGSLPPGLTLAASTGVISGTPTTAGGYVVTLRLSNAYGQTDVQLSIRVVDGSAAAAVSPWSQWLQGR